MCATPVTAAPRASSRSVRRGQTLSTDTAMRSGEIVPEEAFVIIRAGFATALLVSLALVANTKPLCCRALTNIYKPSKSECNLLVRACIYIININSFFRRTAMADPHKYNLWPNTVRYRLLLR